MTEMQFVQLRQIVTSVLRIVAIGVQRVCSLVQLISMSSGVVATAQTVRENAYFRYIFMPFFTHMFVEWTLTYPSSNLFCVQHITVTLISACGFALFSLLIATCVYSFYKYYWTRRHFFEVLE